MSKAVGSNTDPVEVTRAGDQVSVDTKVGEEGKFGAKSGVGRASGDADFRNAGFAEDTVDPEVLVDREDPEVAGRHKVEVDVHMKLMILMPFACEREH